MDKKYPSEAIYNKLVRDKIPEIIEADGSKAETRQLTDKEVVKELQIKAVEEATELSEAQDKEEITKEMSDVLEIIHSLSERLNVSMNEIERIRQIRAEKRGGFKKGIYLIRTYREDK